MDKLPTNDPAARPRRSASTYVCGLLYAGAVVAIGIFAFGGGGAKDDKEKQIAEMLGKENYAMLRLWDELECVSKLAEDPQHQEITRSMDLEDAVVLRLEGWENDLGIYPTQSGDGALHELFEHRLAQIIAAGGWPARPCEHVDAESIVEQIEL